jgi:hypothetical protein
MARHHSVTQMCAGPPFAFMIDDPRINGRLFSGAEIDGRTACFGSENESTVDFSGDRLHAPKD